MASSNNYAPPKPEEYHEYYHAYVSKANSKKFLKAFAAQPFLLKKLLGSLETGEDSRLHEPYTWTLKQVVGHLIDCERTFSTRMWRIAVGDTTPIPGIDQNMYVANLDYEKTTMADLLEEFGDLRAANLRLVKRIPPDSLANMGTASDNPISARANLYILAGHVVYHLDIIKQRLGV